MTFMQKLLTKNCVNIQVKQRQERESQGNQSVKCDAINSVIKWIAPQLRRFDLQCFHKLQLTAFVNNAQQKNESEGYDLLA